MRRFLLLFLALALAGCSALPGASSAALPDASPVVIVQTVLVTAAPTQAAPPEPASPQPTAAAAPQVIVVTATSSAPGTDAGASPTPFAFEPTAPLPPDAGGGIFVNMTRSGDKFSLRCQPDVLTFSVSTSNPYVTGVDLYYRIQDRLSVSISNWAFGASMQSDKHGNFTLDFPAAWVDADVRSHRAWFDYQFIAVNKTADALGRSAKISKQVAYTIDCDD